MKSHPLDNSMNLVHRWEKRVTAGGDYAEQ